MSDAFVKAINDLDEEAFQLLYGRWDPLEPERVADLLSPSSVRWWIAGGRAARVGAPARHHEDTDVVVRADDLGELRTALSDWHLWETNSGTLRPLLPGAALTEGCEQLWARRNAQQPWQLDLALDRSQDEWVFKRDARAHVPWQRALHTVNGIPTCGPKSPSCTRLILTGQKTEQTWPRPTSTLRAEPGWPERWKCSATIHGRNLSRHDGDVRRSAHAQSQLAASFWIAGA
jgi:hypothetical protein